MHVRVPATSANLGPGFDALGLALELYDDLIAKIGDDDTVIDVAGEDAESVPRDESHLVIRTMRATFERLGGQPRAIELVAANRIPHGRGLGSSAAAIVAGVLLARALVLGGAEVLPDDELLAFAGRLEGHPDNVAPCLKGGLTVAWGQDGRFDAIRLECDPTIRPVALIPPTSSSTDEVRKLLPADVPHGDAAYNAARSALLVAALTGAPHALLAATDDRLHQRYRASAMPDSAALLAALRADGLPAVISGAGPTVLTLARSADETDRALAQVPDGWRAELLPVDRSGARVGPVPVERADPA
jgi:homoserine kinase